MSQILFQFVVKVLVRTDLIEVDDHEFNRYVSGRRSVSYWILLLVEPGLVSPNIGQIPRFELANFWCFAYHFYLIFNRQLQWPVSFIDILGERVLETGSHGPILDSNRFHVKAKMICQPKR